MAWTDGYLYSIMRYGRGVMPRYDDKIRGQDRWHVVNYVRQLQAAARAQSGQAGGTD
jgi:mono/diheme cytochrome c family protein